MHYIVLDFEWNQPTNSTKIVTEPFQFDSEIIEIGAVKMDEQYRPVDEFKTFIKPVFYPDLNGIVSRLTKIGKESIQNAPGFPEAYRAFTDFCGEDCALCTWGPDDIPVLFDNLIMHGMNTSMPVCYDLQRIFAHEIMRDDRQYSLENAMKLLRQEDTERAHDALNDARNTARTCSFMELDTYMQEYALVYVDYPADRTEGRITWKKYPNMDAVRQDEALTHATCPYCGEKVVFGNWAQKSFGKMLGYAQCTEGNEFFIRCMLSKTAEGEVKARRVVYEMNDDLWDIYQTLLEESGEKVVKK